MKCPTEKQYELLRMLGSGSAWLSARKRECEPLLRRGWVTGDWNDPFYQMVRITPDGLRALAEGLEKYGPVKIKGEPRTHVRVCADCGSGSYRFKDIPVDEYQRLARKARPPRLSS